jgi:hypothetical protein
MLVKGAIATHRSEFLSFQRLSKLNETVIPAGQIDDPLAYEPPQIVDANWDGKALRITLDRPVHQRWVEALQNMRSGQTIWVGLEPERFRFHGNQVVVAASSNMVQHAINSLKEWMPHATRMLKYNLENEARAHEAELRSRLKQEQKAEEERLQVNRNLKI